MGWYKMCQTTHNRDSRRRRQRNGDWKYIWRNYGWKLYKSKWNTYQDTGSTEGPKQVEPKQAHTKIYYNKHGKKLKIEDSKGSKRNTKH